MTGLLFAHPEWLAPGLAIVSAVALALVWADARSRRAVRALLGDSAFANARVRSQARSRTLRDASLIAALLWVYVGLLGPRIGRENVELSTSGIDVVLLLDTSRSMDARDVPPSRFDASRRAARALLGALGPGDRSALAAFAGRGVLLTPLTSDHAALSEMVPSIETDLVKPGGSNLPAGIATALEAFEPVDERPRAVFVMSDGEMTGHTAAEAVVPAARSNTRVIAAAFGTREGTTIPDHGVSLRDDDGRIVTSHRRLRHLEEMAAGTGGRLFVTDAWGLFDVEDALRTLHAPVAAAPGAFVSHPITVPLVVPFAAAAFALLLLEWLARGGGVRLPRPLALIAICAVSIAATPGDAPERPAPDARALLRAGLEHAAHGSWPRARASFLASALASEDSELRAVAYHDLGIAALRERDLEAARDAFLDALASTHDSSPSARIARTQWNLEWVLDRIDEAPPEPPEPPPPSERPDPSGRETPPEPEAGQGQSPEPESPEGSEAGPALDERSAARTEGAESAPPLDDRQREAWLARVEDDPRRALLSAAFESHEDRSRRKLGGPTW